MSTELTEAILKYVALEKELLADGSDENASTVVFVTNKLLTIAALCDVGDEVGRRLLSQLASDMLVSAATSDVLLPALVDCIAHTHKKTNDRIDVVTGIIRELADDNNYRNTGGLDTSLVVDTETDIADFTADDRQFRSLAICSLFLEKTRRLNINHGEMSALIDNLILPGIQNHNTFIREQAIRSLGLCCVINPEFGRDYLLLLLQVAENDGPRIQLTAVKTLFDLLLVYGPLTLGVSSAHVESDRKREQQADVIRESMNNMSLMENDLEALGDKDTGENESDTEATVDTTIKTYIPILFNLLQSDTAEMRTVAAEGFAKLLHTNHLASHTVFAALMVLYFNPMSSDDQRLRQCLGVFFPEFAFATARPVADKSLAHQAIIERSFLQIMNTLLDAPRRSPLYEVNEYQVGAYLLYLTSPEQLNQNNPNYSSGASLFEAHHALAITIANECLHAAKDGDNYYMKLWSKLLNVIEIEHENQQLVKAMRVIIADLRKECNDSVAQKQLQRSAHQLADYDQTPDDWISRSDIEGLFDNLLKGLDRAFLDGVDEVLATTANTDGSVKRTLRARSVKAPTKTDNSDSEVASDGADESDEESESEADIQEADLDDPESTDEEMA
ncbi:hypothetical protein SARC_02521 [Sphaeroforma arctica JP610]|uniref:Nuclear condensin complex subunit 3 C-terminal domain-containing protein n=1 Tax=Sphaeroforma arctica JP610 TaxID=667725 RepID=A0A0L0GAL7_9EUKA|nr:hypothetical protein SARC_02521 [Sphaeroforma arctica JP610]KNC85298.1 hypothetical protein SARC_02521 [Sphaeroforma arctica JP610]|eukprot:XP_014159200.1 hypothetical protein SARC_02521 [Sphaeroforma arctica JP610]